jgi:DNA-binding NarL/FixJ family response regulator
VSDRVRLLLADDHTMLRQSLRRTMEDEGLEVVGEAGDGEEAARLAEELVPDVVLMDVSMPVLDGVEATRRITGADPDARIVVLTSFSDNRRILDALQAGAIGYLLKHAGPDELLGAVRAAAAGDSPMDPKAARVLLESRRVSRQAQDLSAREEEVLRLVAGGLANKQIARRLEISERTVKAHLTSVFARIGVSDRTQAALWASQHLPEA